MKLLEVLKSIGADWRGRRLIERLYMGQSGRVRLKAVIGRGTRQGCSLSPIRFNIYYEAMLRDALSGGNYILSSEVLFCMETNHPLDLEEIKRMCEGCRAVRCGFGERYITWSYKVCNDEIMRRVGEERAIISVIYRRQRVWLGYTLQHVDLVPLIT